MPWFFYSILTSLFFVGMILFVKRLTNLGFSSKQILFFLYIFTLSGFVILNIISPSPIWKSDKLPFFLLVMSIAGLFAFVGNWADFEAINKSPNPGYPTAVRNTTILPVTLLSIVIFSSAFSWLKFWGALLIVAGIILLVVEKRSALASTGKTNRSPWHFLAFLALFCFTVLVLAQKQALLIPSVSTIEINLLMSLINFLAFGLFSLKDFKNYFSDKIKLKTFLPLVFLAAAFSFLANFLAIKGLALAPNPGYHEAIKNTNVLFVTLLSLKLFSVRFDKLKIFGVILAVSGMIILVI